MWKEGTFLGSSLLTNSQLWHALLRTTRCCPIYKHRLRVVSLGQAQTTFSLDYKRQPHTYTPRHFSLCKLSLKVQWTPLQPFSVPPIEREAVVQARQLGINTHLFLGKPLQQLQSLIIQLNCFTSVKIPFYHEDQSTQHVNSGPPLTYHFFCFTL